MVKLTICCSGWRMCMQNVLFQLWISSPLTYLWILTSFTWWMVPLPFTSILQNTVSGQKLDGGKVWNEAKPQKLSVTFSHFAQIYDSNYMLTENCLQCKKWNPYNFYISKLLSLRQQGEKRSTMAFLQQNPTAVNPLDSPIWWHPHPPVPPFLLTK